MSHSHTADKIPAPLLYACGALMAGSIVIAGMGAATREPAAPIAAESIEQSLAVRFVDDADGGVSAFDAQGNHLHTYPPGTGGFVRTAMRAVVYKRRTAGIGQETPFELLQTKAGNLLLIDPETQSTVHLKAFGDGNARTFSQLFDQQETSS